MNVNAVNSGAPPPYEICDSVDHLTLNYQVGSLFAQDTNEFNYVNNFNPGLQIIHIPILITRVGGTIQISLIGLTLTLQIYHK